MKLEKLSSLFLLKKPWKENNLAKDPVIRMFVASFAFIISLALLNVSNSKGPENQNHSEEPFILHTLMTASAPIAQAAEKQTFCQPELLKKITSPIERHYGEYCVVDSSRSRCSDGCGKDLRESDPLPIVRKNTAPRRMNIPSLMPKTETKSFNGLRVCAKSNDKPSKSDKNKKGHMDMECCLDPDEIPNPNCYYDPKKYGKYLK